LPFFKTTHNILTKPWEDELFDPNWMDSDTLKLPLSVPWDYQREMRIEDVDVWEVLYQASNGVGVYAAWMPYAEFYMICKGWDHKGSVIVETHYGAGSLEEVKKRAKQLNIPLTLKQIWVDPEDMWLYEPIKDPSKKIII
jgi:hypothetical protein